MGHHGIGNKTEFRITGLTAGGTKTAGAAGGAQAEGSYSNGASHAVTRRPPLCVGGYYGADAGWLRKLINYAALFCCFTFHFAQRALCASAIRLRAAGDKLRLPPRRRPPLPKPERTDMASSILCNSLTRRLRSPRKSFTVLDRFGMGSSGFLLTL